MSFDKLVKSINNMLENEDINIVERTNKGDDYEFVVKLMNDIDHPDYCRITLRKETI